MAPANQVMLVRDCVYGEIREATIPPGYVRVWYGPVHLRDMIVNHHELFHNGATILTPMGLHNVRFKEDARDFSCVLRPITEDGMIGDVGKPCQRCRACPPMEQFEGIVYVLCSACADEVSPIEMEEDEDNETGWDYMTDDEIADEFGELE